MFSGVSPAVLPFCDNCAVSDDQLQTLVVRLDYCNATMASLPAYLLNHLQSVLNASMALWTWWTTCRVTNWLTSGYVVDDTPDDKLTYIGHVVNVVANTVDEVRN